MDVRLCTDCRYYEANPRTSKESNLDKCLRPGAAWATVDLVRGEHRPAWCEIERTGTSRPGACGPTATYWEPSLGYLKSVDDEEAVNGYPV